MSNTTNLQIEGMTCGHCVRAVTQTLEGMSGVQTANVDLASGTASVVHDGTLDIVAATKAIEEEGYTARVASPR